MADSELVVPTLHPNGSDWPHLRKEYVDGMRALKTAVENLPRPNARDYYPQGDDAYPKARDQYNAQIRKLTEINNELNMILIGIQDQKRKARG